MQTVRGLPGLEFDTTYARLPDRFFAHIKARQATAPELVKLNPGLAEVLRLDVEEMDSAVAAKTLAGNGLPGEGTLLAMAYSGHQFGQFNPELGDGRAGLIGEVIGKDKIRYDVQLKGSGPTPFSRAGDGLAALGPVMREYIVSEAMHALGIPTTRSLAIVLTGDGVFREKVLPGAVLTRVARSHLRIGTFQHFAARGDIEGLRLLADYAIERHYRTLQKNENPYLALLKQVIERQANLVARWMGVGFIHGVMNTDNMTISGETIDYGPCAFMDYYDHNKVLSSIDRMGRYAYGAQPQIAQWNLARLAEALVPLINKDEGKSIELATKAVQNFADIFSTNWHDVMGKKFGLSPSADKAGTYSALIRDFLTLLQKHDADFTTAFRALTHSVGHVFETGDLTFLFNADPEFETWYKEWRSTIEGRASDAFETMKFANPLYMPRNHLVEEAIRAGEDHKNFDVMEKLLGAVLDPFNEREGLERYALPPTSEQEVKRTYCGT